VNAKPTLIRGGRGSRHPRMRYMKSNMAWIKRFGTAVPLIAVVAGCATTSTMVPIQYEASDMPVIRRIEITYINKSRHTICLLPEQWPNSGGKINQGADVVSLRVGSEVFRIVDFNTGYCPQGCTVQVDRAESARSFFSYDDFDLPERMTMDAKVLEFRPLGFYCDHNSRDRSM
jgi:hypothetical protein